jgi:toxin-antitoxin system PIN domain toxin
LSAALLDVNVLIALLDPRHVDHERAHTWLAASAPLPWASCPLTENAVLRILGNPRYPNSPGPPAVVAPLLEAWRSLPRHRFWAIFRCRLTRLSLLTPGVLGSDRLLDPSQITDAYLLALAVDHGGSLVTLDRRLRPELVAGGAEALVVLDGL